MDPQNTRPIAIRVLGQATVLFCIVFALSLTSALADGSRGLADTNGLYGRTGAWDCGGGRLGLPLAMLRLRADLSKVCLRTGQAWCSKGVLALWKPNEAEAIVTQSMGSRELLRCRA